MAEFQSGALRQLASITSTETAKSAAALADVLEQITHNAHTRCFAATLAGTCMARMEQTCIFANAPVAKVQARTRALRSSGHRVASLNCAKHHIHPVLGE